MAKFNSPYKPMRPSLMQLGNVGGMEQVGNVGGAREGDQAPVQYAPGSEPTASAPTSFGAPQLLDHELSDPNWRGYFDALKAAGVDRLSTAEASKMNDPYSKLQTPDIPGDIRTSQPGWFDRSQQQESLAGLLRVKDMSQYGRIR